MVENEKTLNRVYNMSFFDIYDLYLKKIEKKGRKKEELDNILSWLTGFRIQYFQNKTDINIKDFFYKAPAYTEKDIKGKICGVQIEQIIDPIMKKVRQMDKIVDELAKGKTLDKIMRNNK